MPAAFGCNLGPGAKPAAWAVNDLSLDSHAMTVRPDARVWKPGHYHFSEHPTGHSVLPTAATGTLTGFDVAGVSLLVTDTAVTLECGRTPGPGSKRSPARDRPWCPSARTRGQPRGRTPWSQPSKPVTLVVKPAAKK